MSDIAGTIERLYAALAAADGEAMAACYAPGATFQDPAFGRLEGPEVEAMWRMLTTRSTGVVVELREHAAAGVTGRANWIATYRFGPKQRPVVNDVRSTYRFTPEGQILEQVDRFDVARWGGQAIGPVAGLLGRTRLLGLLVRRTARRDLDAFRAAA